MMKRTPFPRLGENCYFERLENGLPIYVAVKPEFEKSYAFFAVNYGGMNLRFRSEGEWRETPAGVAHYLEHKMFDMPEGNALQTLSANGASPNAFTGAAITGYYFSCTRHFAANLRTLLTFVSTPYYTQESVDKEQGIIGQEIAMVEDNPDWRLFHNLLKGLYEHNPLRISVAGSKESISHITPELLYCCHKAFYHPENMVLCAAGDVDPEQVAAIARMTLAGKRGTMAEKDLGAPEAMNAFAPQKEERMAVAAPTFLVGFKAEPHPQGEENLRLQLLGDLAGELLCGDGSSLYQSLYEEGLINKSFGVTYEDYPSAAFLACGGESPRPEEVARRVLAEAERLDREGIDPERFERCRRAAYGSRVRGLNSFEHCCIQLAQGQFKGYHYYRFPELYDVLTAEDAAAFLRRVVREERMCLSVIRPLEESE